jgi:reverse gyrase
MIYYSTGKGTFLNKKGAAVEVNHEGTAQILLQRGYITESLDNLKPKAVQVEEKKVEIVEEAKPFKHPDIIELPKKRKGNPNWGKK